MNIRDRIRADTGLQRSPLVTEKHPRGAKADMLHSITVVRQEGRRGDTRVADRYRIAGEAVRVTHDGRTHEAQLINVCASGAMIAAAFEAQPWDKVKLLLDGSDARPIAGHVLWIRDGRIGVEFAEAIRLDRADNELRELIVRHFPEAHFDAPPEPQPEAEPAAAARTEDQRAEHRSPLLRMAKLHYDYDTTAARLRNISATGAAIETETKLEPGAEPLLDMGEAGSIFATVVWTDAPRAGLRFNQLFDLDRLPRAHAQSGPASWEPPAYLRTNAHCDTRWAEDADPASLDDLDGFLKR